MNKDFDPSRRNGLEPKIPPTHDKFNDWLTLMNNSQFQLLAAISELGKSADIVDPDLIQMEQSIHSYTDRVNWATEGRYKWAKHYSHLNYGHRMDLENIIGSSNGLNVLLANVELATTDNPLKLSQIDVSEHMEYFVQKPIDMDFYLFQSLNHFLKCKGFMTRTISQSNEKGTVFEYSQYSEVGDGKRKYYKYLETPPEDGSNPKLTFTILIW